MSDQPIDYLARQPMEVNDARPLALRGGIGSGGNTASNAGWQGTVHSLSAADKAANFRKSLDHQRAAAHPQAAAVGSAIVDASVAEIGAAGERFTVKPPERPKPPDRTGEFEDEIARLKAQVEELYQFMRDAQGPFKNVFLAGPNLSDPGKPQQWQEMTAQGTSITTFQDGRSCLGATNSGQILQPGSNGAFALLEIRDGDKTAYFKLGGSEIQWVSAGTKTAAGKYYPSVVALPSSGDILTTDNIYDVEVWTGTGESVILCNANEEGTPLVELEVGQQYLASYWKTNTTGVRVFRTLGFKKALVNVQSGTPTVSGTTLSFPNKDVVVFSPTNKADITLTGDACA